MTLLAACLSLAGIAEAQQRQPQKFYRPKRFAPPVHAQPRGNYRPAQQISDQPQRTRYPVRQAAYQQEIPGGSIGDLQGIPQPSSQGYQQSADQWRTRTNQAPQNADEFLRSAAERYESNIPGQNQALHPQQDFGQNQRFSDVAMPDTELQQPRSDSGFSQYEIPLPRNGAPIAQPLNRQAQPAMDQMTQQSLGDQPPAMEDYTTDPFTQTAPAQPPLGQQASDEDYGQSVLVKDHPLRQEQSIANDNAANGDLNELRNLRVQPRRLRDAGGLNHGNAYRSNYRTPARGTPGYDAPGYGWQETAQDSADLGVDDTDDVQPGSLKSCEDFRQELLNDPITNIVLDISPLRPSAAAQDTPFGLTRTWTDCNGAQLGTGTLTGMERSYIVITNESGTQQRIPLIRLSDGDLAVVTEYWGLPDECSLGCFPYNGRCWMPNTVFWKATALCHKPLYFENRQLERYGHTHGPVVEPVHATAHFFGSLIGWPYQTAINPPNECLYALGFYRPGDCAPWLKEPIPLSLKGAARTGIAIGGAALIIP